MTLFNLLLLLFALLHLAFVRSKEEFLRGQHLTQGKQRNLQNQTVDINEAYPYLAYIKITGKDGTVYSCAGTLVHSMWVLTAASCVEYADKVTVILGSSTIGQELCDKVEEPPIECHPINLNDADFFPEYDTGKKHGDFVLLKLAEPSSKTFAILNYNYTSPADHQTVWIAGWGAAAGADPESITVEHVSLERLSDFDCTLTPGGEEIAGDNAIQCAKGDGIHDTCIGDSGGPVIVQTEKVSTVVGVLSWSNPPECPSDQPYWYNRVVYATLWMVMGHMEIWEEDNKRINPSQ
jgi:secreted trypsin-like serine protease